MKKILIVACDDLGIGGVQSVIMNIVRGLNEKYIFDIVLFRSPQSYYEEEFSSYGGNIFRIPHDGEDKSFLKKIGFYFHFFSDAKEFKRILRECGPYDAIHCHPYFESAIYLRLARKAKIPVRIAHSHSCYPKLPKYKLIRRIYQSVFRRLIMQNATELLACSEQAGRYLFGNDCLDRIKVVNNGIDLREYKQIIINEEVDPWRLIHVGRWSKSKNQIFLIEILNDLRMKYGKGELTLVGYGTQEDKRDIVEKIEKYNLGEYVYFKPSDIKIPEELNKNNIFVFPSTYEGFGIVLVEAQAVGLKCFSSSAVPKESDLGNVTFLDLSLGHAVWAKAIAEYIRKNGSKRKILSLKGVDIEEVNLLYSKIYDNK